MLFWFLLPYVLIIGGYKIFKRDFRIITSSNIFTFILQIAIIIGASETIWVSDETILIFIVVSAIILIPVSNYLISPLLHFGLNTLNKLKVWNKLRTWQKYSIFFILLHWALFFYLGYVINGHPPIPLMILEAPVVILYSLIGREFGYIDIIFISSTILIYALIGTTVGFVVEILRKRKRNDLKISSLILLLIFLFMFLMPSSSHALWWMIYHKPEFKGKVIDADTKEPIEGAVVVVTYSKTTHLPPEAYSSIIDVRETLTDKKGEFYIPSYMTLIQPLSSEEWARFIIFKPGYGSFPSYHISPPKLGVNPEVFFSTAETGTEGEITWLSEKIKVTFSIVELPKLKTREERLNSLRSANLHGEVPWKKIKNLMRLINEEYKSLGITPYKEED